MGTAGPERNKNRYLYFNFFLGGGGGGNLGGFFARQAPRSV